MPLIKQWHGRRVRKTRRKGRLILVKLARSREANAPADWVPMTQPQYRAGLKCTFACTIEEPQ